MRPLRLLLTLASSVLCITLLLYVLPHRSDRIDGAAETRGTFSTMFSFHSPLFPPSAIISLTDDNSTFFLARPAAFGPSLPAKGLSGQLWIGSGFGDDNLGRGGFTAGAEGELGCSDVPGWDKGAAKVVNVEAAAATQPELPPKDKAIDEDEDGDLEEEELARGEQRHNDGDGQAAGEGDGTDDHLHWLVRGSSKGIKPGHSRHADIESIQESAEIAGKVVLLSRGGCGFLEKVKWAQRRGGIGVIVGDDVVGGPLVTMYASGDTSNVTIPALFTSHMTAHLLSSLVPPGAFFATKSGNNAIAEPRHNAKEKTKRPTKEKSSIFASVSTSSSSSSLSPEDRPGPVKQTASYPKKSWLGTLLHLLGFGTSDRADVSRRPPSSGLHDWIQLEECIDCEPRPKSHKAPKSSKVMTAAPKDDFVIGVQDWRDPDLLERNNAEETLPVKPRAAAAARQGGSKTETQLKGNSIVPGSGEYEKPDPQGGVSKSLSVGHVLDEPATWSGGWFNHLFGHGRKATGKVPASDSTLLSKSQTPSRWSKGVRKQEAQNEPSQHEGLWVTLSPTNLSSSPFFDTLLVLVVSPLVTLTVVYALLLLRSRIRRRRWRAPKSVVERLPVRTYHTLSSQASSSALATPVSASPTTPLLQSSSRRILSRSQSRSRPRSLTASEVPEQSSSAPPADPSDHSSNESEKREGGLAEWRRRYGGRQKECVVCLEEYVDGVSRVMSLPCGHEFHAECITPWLVTRRRTCPICKGDVVRSMARQSGQLSRQSSFGSELNHRDGESDDEEDVQTQAAFSRNDSPAAALPIPNGTETDLERAANSRGRSNPLSSSSGWSSWGFLNGWGFATPGSSASSGLRPSQSEAVDRDR